MIKLLIGQEMITAKNYLKQKNKDLSEEDLIMINVLVPYSLEAIIICVMGKLFNNAKNLPLVRVSTLIDQLDYGVRFQARILKSKEEKVEINGEKAVTGDKVTEKAVIRNKVKKKGKQVGSKASMKAFSIGHGLYDLLVERNLIKRETSDSKSETNPVSTSGRYYKLLGCNAMCNFDLSILPIHLNLPMLTEPLPWK